MTTIKSIQRMPHQETKMSEGKSDGIRENTFSQST